MESMESTERPHKHSRTSEDGDGAAVASGKKKARGRPRVDTQDATAADVSIALFSFSRSPHVVTQFFRNRTTNRSRKTNVTTSVEEHRSVLRSAPTDSVKKQLYLRSRNRTVNCMLSSTR